ncbi:hypothetical protein [Acidithiobacillus ferrivorans]|uniref:Uncharacterized protein n=1 Tax=Acidithiobacillus ferrivorans TaxID=160808 RepID=A0A7T4WC22_9PROT|nr:hypothetical protein [Acidithiobacillus ferrivorans]QQD71630.1 hypothetical protein H2515_09130 [Acidithiobacillus ferrivorans]
MIAAAKKDASRLGTLIRLNGTRLPITGLQPNGEISVRSVYVGLETTIGATIAYGYSLEDAIPALIDAWDNATAWTRRWMFDAPN